jgi:hypothetical protein
LDARSSPLILHFLFYSLFCNATSVIEFYNIICLGTQIGDNKTYSREQISATKIINVWLNGNFVGEVQPTYFAWYDFPDNPDHLSGEVELILKEGENILLILAQDFGKTGKGSFFPV